MGVNYAQIMHIINNMICPDFYLQRNTEKLEIQHKTVCIVVGYAGIVITKIELCTCYVHYAILDKIV